MSEHDGVAERHDRSLLELCRAMLYDGGLPRGRCPPRCMDKESHPHTLARGTIAFRNIDWRDSMLSELLLLGLGARTE